ncbi:hypothetical protein AHAS_Ahas10G0099400 [Arachis hypogaea]
MIVYCVPHLWEPSLLLCLSLILKQCGEPQNCPLQLQHEFITSCFALTSYISFLPFSLSFSLSLSDTLSSSLQTVIFPLAFLSCLLFCVSNDRSRETEQWNLHLF